MSSLTPLALRLIMVLAACIPMRSAAEISEITLYSGSSLSFWEQSVLLGAAQRCITMKCYLSKTDEIRFDVQDVANVVFFTEAGCQGKHVKLPRGDQDGWFTEYKMPLDNAASMMVWESSIYPTRGIVDFCA